MIKTLGNNGWGISQQAVDRDTAVGYQTNSVTASGWKYQKIQADPDARTGPEG